ncbi:hypothetical protein EON63_16895 [archaeon]|nr:MAG: hypothetical protein EON63_16895 [archaeon]
MCDYKVLILDVARFKYPPHWVKVEDLYAAMCTTDTETGKSLSNGKMLIYFNIQCRPTQRISIHIYIHTNTDTNTYKLHMHIHMDCVQLFSYLLWAASYIL